MASHSFFLGGIDLAGVTLARVDERESIGTYSQLIEEVRARCGTEVASLFAEPIKGVNRSTNMPNIAWYCNIEGTPFLLRQLDATARLPIIELLKQRLLSFSSVLGDPRSGALLGSWLYILSPDSIMAVSGQPVIKNWGMVPAEFAGSDEARDTHFRNTIGLYLPNVPTPPFSEIEAQSFAGRMAQLAERESAKAARPPLPASDMGRIPYAPPSAAPLPPPPPPSPSRPWRLGWIAPAVACAIAGIFLLLFLFGHILRYPGLEISDDSLIEAQRKTNKALQDRLDQLKRASTDVCTAPGSPQSRRSSELLPPSPTDTKVTAQEQGRPPETRALGAVLDKATVLVLADNSTGSGFFISDHIILTNYHVVGSTIDVRIGNKSLGGFVPAKVVAHGAGPGRGRQDIAVLEITARPDATFLRIAPTPDQLEQVTAAGYPGALLETQRPDGTTMPEVNFTQGIVTSRQTQAPDNIKTVVHTAQIGHGNSGGPLVDPGGCVVGMNSWGAFDATGQQVTGTFYEALDPTEIQSFLKGKNIAFTGSDKACVPVAVAPPPADQQPARPR